jgi:hypothetical protein
MRNERRFAESNRLSQRLTSYLGRKRASLKTQRNPDEHSNRCVNGHVMNAVQSPLVEEQTHYRERPQDHNDYDGSRRLNTNTLSAISSFRADGFSML